MKFGFGLPTRGPMAAPQSPRHASAYRRGIRFCHYQCERSRHHPEGHQLHVPLQRERYVCRQSIG